MDVYYELSQKVNQVSELIDPYLYKMEVIRMTSELEKQKFTKPHIPHKTKGGTFIWIDTSYVKT